MFLLLGERTAPAGNNTFTVTQTIMTSNFNTLFTFWSGSNVFDSNCVSLQPTITQNTTTGVMTVAFNAPTADPYIISIKYKADSVSRKPPPSPGTTVHSTQNVNSARAQCARAGV